ncbi:hypothetical protein Dsin_016059 [Dipteronia sinensis]|uniref:Uncharacterized protein n=1 Tax=Dipteronia sinensis TaxID=43782 RepID=A0AAE0AD57_9ROSI|nr:hypothetical protein Dsin_016059 [Dipteronia sinensis]
MDRSMRGWNNERLNQLLLPVDKMAILSIPVSWGRGKDSLRWHYEKMGVYTVKNGYCLGLSAKFPNSVSNPSAQHMWWSSLWNRWLPPKIRIFV